MSSWRHDWLGFRSNQSERISPVSSSSFLCELITLINSSPADYIPPVFDDYTISYDFLLDGFYFARGVSYYYNKNFLEAINDYNSVLGMRIDKTTALRAFENRGHAKVELDDISGACKDFNIVKKILKEDGDDYSNIQKLIDSNCSK